MILHFEAYGSAKETDSSAVSPVAFSAETLLAKACSPIVSTQSGMTMLFTRAITDGAVPVRMLLSRP